MSTATVELKQTDYACVLRLRNMRDSFALLDALMPQSITMSRLRKIPGRCFQNESEIFLLPMAV